jgi:hypothetical protein
VIIIVSIPTFFAEIIPYPYDWGIKLFTHVMGRFLPLIPLLFLSNKKGFYLFAGATLLLIPQAISDCGILHSLFPNFTIYESAFDWSISGVILILYFITLYLLAKELLIRKGIKNGNM